MSIIKLPMDFFIFFLLMNGAKTFNKHQAMCAVVLIHRFFPFFLQNTVHQKKEFVMQLHPSKTCNIYSDLSTNNRLSINAIDLVYTF